MHKDWHNHLLAFAGKWTKLSTVWGIIHFWGITEISCGWHWHWRVIRFECLFGDGWSWWVLQERNVEAHGLVWFKTMPSKKEWFLSFTTWGLWWWWWWWTSWGWELHQWEEWSHNPNNNKKRTCLTFWLHWTWTNPKTWVGDACDSNHKDQNWRERLSTPERLKIWTWDNEFEDLQIHITWVCN
jgi:hypothetical protein